MKNNGLVSIIHHIFSANSFDKLWLIISILSFITIYTKLMAVNLLTVELSVNTHMYALGLNELNLVISWILSVYMKIISAIISKDKEIAPKSSLS